MHGFLRNLISLLLIFAQIYSPPILAENPALPVYESYRNLLKDFRPDGEAAMIKKQVDGFLGTAKNYLSKNPQLRGTDDYNAIENLAGKTKTFQYVINKMREGGCLNSEDEKIRYYSQVVLQGALAAEPCELICRDLAQNFRDIVNYMSPNSLTQADPKLLPENNNKATAKARLDFAQSVISAARSNNEKSQWYLDYKYTGKRPNRDGVKETGACKRFMTQLSTTESPFNKTEMAAKANEAFKSTQLEVEKLKTNQAKQRSMTPQQAKSWNPTKEFKHKAEEVFEAPGMAMLAYTKDFDENYGTYLRGEFAKPHCRPVGRGGAGNMSCTLYLDGVESKSISTADIGRTVESAKADLKKVEHEILKPLDSKIAKMQKNLAKPQAPNRYGAGQQVTDSQISQVLFDLMKKRPLEFGSALIEHPEFAANICGDVVAAVDRMTNEEFWDNVKSVVLVAAVFALALPTFGTAGLVAGALIAVYEFNEYNNKAHEYEEKLLDVVDRSMVSAVNQKPPAPEEIHELREGLEHKAEHARLYRNLVLLGIIAPAYRGVEGTLKIAKSPATAKLIEQIAVKLNLIKQSTGSHSHMALEHTLEKIGKFSEVGGEMTHVGERGVAGFDYSLETIEAYKDLGKLVKNLGQAAEIPFEQ